MRGVGSDRREAKQRLIAEDVIEHVEIARAALATAVFAHRDRFVIVLVVGCLGLVLGYFLLAVFVLMVSTFISVRFHEVIADATDGPGISRRQRVLYCRPVHVFNIAEAERARCRQR